MKRYRHPLLLLTIVLPLSSASAATDPQLQSIRALGAVTGIALRCHYLKQVQQIKGALITALPKQRSLGELFDSETNRGYLSFVESAAPCPEAVEMGERVHQAITEMEARFVQSAE